VTTNASGTATVHISADRSTIRVDWQTNGLQNVTAAHIHVGGLLDATPPAIGFFNPQQDNPASGSKTLVKGQVSVGAGLTFDDVVNALLSGNAYINFHTQTNPAGEIRGQVGPVTLAAQLTGDQEAPNPVQTNATGSAIVQLNNTQDQITVLVRTTGLQNVTAAHIHVGAVGQAVSGDLQWFGTVQFGQGLMHRYQAGVPKQPLKGVAPPSEQLPSCLLTGAMGRQHIPFRSFPKVHQRIPQPFPSVSKRHGNQTTTVQRPPRLTNRLRAKSGDLLLPSQRQRQSGGKRQIIHRDEQGCPCEGRILRGCDEGSEFCPLRLGAQRRKDCGER